MNETDLDTDLAALAQRLGDIAFSLRVILELRHSADNLTLPLAAELRAVRLQINRILPRLPREP